MHKQRHHCKHRKSHLVHVANPCLLHLLTALGVGHEGDQVLLENIFGFPVECAVVLPWLLKVVLLLNALLHTRASNRGLNPCGPMCFAGSLVIQRVLLSGFIVDLQPAIA